MKILLMLKLFITKYSQADACERGDIENVDKIYAGDTIEL